jgi:hypothetical protein
MKEDLDSAAHYRQLAERLRGIAGATEDIRHKETLLKIADDYDRLAFSREKIDEAGRFSKSKPQADVVPFRPKR